MIEPNANTSTTGPASRPATPQEMASAIRELALTPRPPWTLVAPDGRIWQRPDLHEILQIVAALTLKPSSGEPFQLQNGDRFL